MRKIVFILGWLLLILLVSCTEQTTEVPQDLEGNIYNVGCGKGIPLIEIVKKIVQIAGSGKIVYVPWPETNKKIDVGDFTANIDKIKKEIGWRARVPLEEGLSQTIQFYKENKKYYW